MKREICAPIGCSGLGFTRRTYVMKDGVVYQVYGIGDWTYAKHPGPLPEVDTYEIILDALFGLNTLEQVQAGNYKCGQLDEISEELECLTVCWDFKCEGMFEALKNAGFEIIPDTKEYLWNWWNDNKIMFRQFATAMPEPKDEE
jgi:hypothetical protein